MHSTANRKSTAALILLATILTVGLMAVWAVAFGVGAMVVSMFSPSRRIDQLVFTIEGQPLLLSYAFQGGTYDYNQEIYRTLDGKRIEDPDSLHLTEASYAREIPPGVRTDRALTGWTWRIVGFLQGRPAPVIWYLIHDEWPDGQAYFAAYEPNSKQLIGYLGRGGFRPSLPPPDERFTIPLNLFFSGAYAPLVGAAGQVPSSQLPNGILYLVSDNSLVKIDLVRQAVEPVAMPERVIAVSTYQELKAVPDDRHATYEDRLVVRLPKELHILSLEGKPLRTFPLAEPLRDATLSLVGTTTDETILQARGDDHWSSELYWVGPQGEVKRHERVTLYRASPPDKRATAWAITGIVPMPAVLLAGSLLAAANKPVGRQPAPDFAAAFAEIVSYAWLPFLTLLAVSAALAFIVYRHQRAVSDHGAVAWAIFVVLLGPPAVVGYWLHRQWPPKARCENCGAVVPRDRATCLACRAVFPSPPPKGIEVFA
ncbi:MAG: hypothetical protein WD063_09100 [Pirellulales bacterium]